MPPQLSSLLFIVVAALLAPMIADAIPRVRVPTAILEIALGVIIGPQVLGLANTEPIVIWMGQFGLAFLFFLAGTELDVERIRGRPLILASLAWTASLSLAVIVAVSLQLVGVVSGAVYVALALVTTTLGTLLPILRDTGEIDTEFGTHVLAAGTVGEFGPILMVAFLLSEGRTRLASAVLINLFVLAVLFAALLARRWRPAVLIRLIQQTMTTSSQVAVRLSIAIVAALVSLAFAFGLDFLLGAFAAGLVVGQVLSKLDRESPSVKTLHAKYEGIGFGLLIPFFFIVSGMQFDLRGLLQSGAGMLLVPLFTVLFLLIRGLPSLLFSRRVLAASDQLSLGLFAATGLPLIIAITELGVAQHQLPEPIATAMVGAGMLSVFVFPLLALVLRRRASQTVTVVGMPAVMGWTEDLPGQQ